MTKKIIFIMMAVLPLISLSYMTSITVCSSTVAYGTNTGKLFGISQDSTAIGYFGNPIYGLLPVHYFKNNIPGFAFFNTDGNFYVVALKDNQFILQYKKKFVQGIKEIKLKENDDTCEFYILTISDKIYRLTFHKDIYTYTYEDEPLVSFDNITEGFILKDGYFIVYDVSGNIFFYDNNFKEEKKISVMTDIRKLFLYSNYLVGFTGDGSLFRIDIANDYNLQFYLNYGKDLLYAFGTSSVYTIFNKDNKTYIERLNIVHGAYLDYLSTVYTKEIANFKTYSVYLIDKSIILGGENKFKTVRCIKDDK